MAKKQLADSEFWAILRESAGIYSRAARAIQKEHGISYTRQAVRQRALIKPEELEDIKQQNVDVAEEGLHSLMRSSLPSIRLRAVELFLKTIGKDRGYTDRTEITGANGEALPTPIINVLKSD
jgi:hypothetical protein